MSDGLDDRLQHARAVADAVLYEGYLLYPYRSTSSKNQARWQFGVLGPQGAAAAHLGEDPALATDLLVRTGPGAVVTVRPRFLQLQTRAPQQRVDGGWRDVDPLTVGTQQWVRWDEAVEQEPAPVVLPLDDLAPRRHTDVDVTGGHDVETVAAADGSDAGRLVRTRHPLRAALDAHVVPAGDGVVRLTLRLENVGDPVTTAAEAIARSLIGTHLLVSIEGGEFVSLTDPDADVATAAGECRPHRCWPVLAGPEGDHSLVLVSPIILYDHPEIAEQSAGPLFDGTEIDEILTLRVMTMTDEEKAAARATDPKAAEIIDRCDAMSPDAMQRLHGVLRDPHRDPHGELRRGRYADVPTFDDVPTFGDAPGYGGDAPWWDPAADASVDPFRDAVSVQGRTVTAGSRVRLHPSRRADAQDLFFAGQLARVTAVHTDVDGETHVAVVLEDDPAADMHEWYGRYLHFAPDEIEPISEPTPAEQRASATRRRSRP